MRTGIVCADITMMRWGPSVAQTPGDRALVEAPGNYSRLFWGFLLSLFLLLFVGHLDLKKATRLQEAERGGTWLTGR